MNGPIMSMSFDIAVDLVNINNPVVSDQFQAGLLRKGYIKADADILIIDDLRFFYLRGQLVPRTLKFDLDLFSQFFGIFFGIGFCGYFGCDIAFFSLCTCNFDLAVVGFSRKKILTGFNFFETFCFPGPTNG